MAHFPVQRWLKFHLIFKQDDNIQLVSPQAQVLIQVQQVDQPQSHQ